MQTLLLVMVWQHLLEVQVAVGLILLHDVSATAAMLVEAAEAAAETAVEEATSKMEQERARAAAAEHELSRVRQQAGRSAAAACCSGWCRCGWHWQRTASMSLLLTSPGAAVARPPQQGCQGQCAGMSAARQQLASTVITFSWCSSMCACLQQ